MTPMQRAHAVLEHTLPHDDSKVLALGMWMDTLGLNNDEIDEVFACTFHAAYALERDAMTVVAVAAMDWIRHTNPALADDDDSIRAQIATIIERMTDIGVKRTDIFTPPETTHHVAH